MQDHPDDVNGPLRQDEWLRLRLVGVLTRGDALTALTPHGSSPASSSRCARRKLSLILVPPSPGSSGPPPLSARTAYKSVIANSSHHSGTSRSVSASSQLRPHRSHLKRQ